MKYFCNGQCIVRPFCMMLILQNVLNWSLENETDILDRTFDIARKRFDKRLLPTLKLSHPLKTKLKEDKPLQLDATSRFNFLPHVFLILKRNFSNQNAIHSIAFYLGLKKRTLDWLGLLECT
jgi:hypothetical protein